MIDAEDRLKAGGVPDDRLYDLVRLATGSEAAAADALYRRVGARLARGETPRV